VGGDETILLVEDDQLLRGVAVRILQRAGYRVHVACNGGEALAVAAGLTGPIHLLVTDVVMPGASGPQVAASLTERRPGLRVLYVSGYPPESLGDRGTHPGGVDLLPKPFTPAALLERVRGALDRARP